MGSCHERRGCCGDRVVQRGAAGSVRAFFFFFFSVSRFFLNLSLCLSSLTQNRVSVYAPPSKFRRRKHTSQLPDLPAAGIPAAPARGAPPSGGAGPAEEGLGGEGAPGPRRRGLRRRRRPARRRRGLPGGGDRVGPPRPRVCFPGATCDRRVLSEGRGAAQEGAGAGAQQRRRGCGRRRR